MRSIEIHKRYGYTQATGQALSLIKVNKILPGESGEKKIEDMICMLYKRRHQIGLDHCIKRLPVLRVALKIIKTL